MKEKEDLKRKALSILAPDDKLLYLHVAGSNMYGLNESNSDVDAKGVYIAPVDNIFSFRDEYYHAQKNDAKNDMSIYEIEKFLLMLSNSNPNVLESLFVPEKYIISKSPIFDIIVSHRDLFVTKMCVDTFLKYAHTQINKSAGLNKKINKPIESDKSVLDFCYHVGVNHGQSQPIKQFLAHEKISYKNIGLQSIPHAKNLYAMYLNDCVVFRGIVSDEETSMDISLSSIPEDSTFIGYMSFNMEGYSTFKKQYTEYNKWVKERNPARYQLNLDNNQGYDCKNMSHCVRLLHMGCEILSGDGVIVDRSEDKQLLLDIKHGKYTYKMIMEYVNSKKLEIKALLDSSTIPDSVDGKFINDLLIRIRKETYGK